MILHITQADVTGPYELRVAFDDGTAKRVNLRSLLTGPVFAPLLDLELFGQVRVDPLARTVTWPHGADLAPEALQDLPDLDAPPGA